MDYKKKIEQLVSDNKIEYTKNSVNSSDIEEYEKTIGIKFGNELIDYITNYGYLAFKHIEFYGINLKQKLDSDLIKQTIYLHENYEITRPYIAIENIGDNIYSLIDENDNIYEVDLVLNNIKNINLKLYEYILKKYDETNNKKISVEVISKIDNQYLKELLSYVVDEPVFFNENKRLLSKMEIENYKSELNVIKDNIIPLIDLYDNEFLIFDIDNNKFKILDISDDFERNADLNLIEKCIKILDSQNNDIPAPKILTCPICNANLMYLEPDGTTLYCKNCNKNFKNNNGSVGDETTSPYTDSNALY